MHKRNKHLCQEHHISIAQNSFHMYAFLKIIWVTVQNTYSILSQTTASVAVVVVSGNTRNVTYYVPTIQRGKHPMAINTQFNLNYTSNRNIHPQCNRLCLQRAYHYKTVSYLLCVLFLQNNGAKRDSHHIGIRRTVAEVSLPHTFSFS